MNIYDLNAEKLVKIVKAEKNASSSMIEKLLNNIVSE